MSTGLQFETAQQELLTKKAWGDFVHDFDDPVRANVTVGVLNQIPIEKTQSLKKAYATLTGIIQKASGGKTSVTAFKLFQSLFTTTIPTSIAVEVPTKPLHENDITGLADIPYATITNGLQATKPQLIDFSAIPDFPPKIAKRAYKVSAFPEKLAGDHIHMVACLNKVTGSQNIVIMWDAGSCEISEIGSPFGGIKTIIPDFNDSILYNIFFINSKENLSDPAPKPTIDTLASKNPNVRIYFLEEADPKAPTIYPVWPHDKSDQNANVFSSYKLVTTRGEGKTIGGTLFTNTGKTIDIEDIKESSKVSNAVANAVLSKLSGETNEQQMAYFFLKRAGDWCQALTLLDKTRVYKIGNGPVQAPDGTLLSTITLGDLEKTMNATSTLITNDRVLLAYGVSLGLNVVFTNVRNSINWIVYFKNAEVVRTDDAGAVIAESSEIFTTIPGFIEQINNARESIKAKIEQTTQILESPQNFKAAPQAFVAAITELRTQLFVFVRLPSSETLQNLQKVFASTGSKAVDANNRGDMQTLGESLSILRTANANYKASVDVANTLLQYSYPDRENETPLLTTIITNVLQGSILTSTSDAYIRFQNIVDKLKNDFKKTGGIVLRNLPSDAIVAQQMSSVGVSLGQTRATRTLPAMTSLGFLYDYYNRTLTGLKGGKRKRLRLKGGGPQNDYVFGTYIVPKLQNAKTIVQYDNNTVDSAYAIDATEFIAKDENFIVMLDGTHKTVVDRFLYEDLTSGYAIGAFNDFKNKIGDDYRRIETDAYYPIMYIVMRGLLDTIDTYYDRLIGYQSLEFSNLDALREFIELKSEISVLFSISDFWDVENPVNTPESLYTILKTAAAWYDYETPDVNPDSVIQEYYKSLTLCTAPVYAGGPPNCAGRDFIESKRVELAPTEDPTVFFEEYGPQYLYSTDVNRTAGKLLDLRDDIIGFFSAPLFPGSPSLRQYSLQFSPQSIPTPDNNLPASAGMTEFSRIEQDIVNSHDEAFGKKKQDGGLRSRRPLYTKKQAFDPK